MVTRKVKRWASFSLWDTAAPYRRHGGSFPLGLCPPVGFCLKSANLCLLAPAVWHGHIQRARVGHKQRCSSPLCCINLVYQAVVVGVCLFKDADSTFTTGDVALVTVNNSDVSRCWDI